MAIQLKEKALRDDYEAYPRLLTALCKFGKQLVTTPSQLLKSPNNYGAFPMKFLFSKVFVESMTEI